MERRLEKTHRITIGVPGNITEDQFDDLAADIMSALVGDANAALGPSVAGSYREKAIHLRFQTVAPSASARATQLAHIYEAIERTLGGPLTERADELDRELSTDAIPA
ncbi:MAG: hypothetical protein AB7G37_01020 [Solirubrobacteraceae bacterium]